MKNIIIFIFLLLALLFVSCEAIDDYLDDEDETLVYDSEVYQVVGGAGSPSQAMKAGASNILVENNDVIPLICDLDIEDSQTFMITNTGNTTLTVNAIELIGTGDTFILSTSTLPQSIAPEGSFYFDIEVVPAIDTEDARVEIDIEEDEKLFTIYLENSSFSLTDYNNGVLLSDYSIDLPNYNPDNMETLSVRTNVIGNSVTDIDFKSGVDIDDYQDILLVCDIMGDDIGQGSFNEFWWKFVATDMTLAYDFQLLWFATEADEWGQFFMVFDPDDFTSDSIDRVQAYTIDGDGNVWMRNIVIIGLE